jgi:hypothetical protein
VFDPIDKLVQDVELLTRRIRALERRHSLWLDVMIVITVLALLFAFARTGWVLW